MVCERGLCLFFIWECLFSKVGFLCRFADKILSHLATWKDRCISIVNKVVLVNSFIMAKFIHYFMVCKSLVALLNKIDRAIYNFVWSEMVDQHKLCTVPLAKCCLPVSKGGLIIKCLKVFNKALLAKLAWKFLSSLLLCLISAVLVTCRC